MNSTPLNINDRRKRRRPITSCGECYRRKQKCDREFPCAICVIRGVPEKCSFDVQTAAVSSLVLPTKRSISSHVSSTPIDSDTIDESSLNPPDLGEQTGYSSMNGSNFTLLQKSIQHVGDIVLSPNKPVKHQLPGFLVYQLAEIEHQLPDRRVQSQLLHLYFQECWWWFSSLEPTFFTSEFEQWHLDTLTAKSTRQALPKEHHYFSALLFQVLAVALQYLRCDSCDLCTALNLGDAKSSDILSVKYSKAGMQVMELLGRHNSTVTAVQHDLLRGIWLKNFSRGTEAWYSLGNAIRQAQELGLYTERHPPDDLDQAAHNRWLWQDLLHRRVTAATFSWDAHVALTLGRPRILNANDCTRMDLVACEYPDDPSSSPPSDPVDATKPILVTPVLFQYSMAFLIHEMLDSGVLRSDFIDYDRLWRLHHSLNALMNRLPPHYRYNNPNRSWDSHYPGIMDMRLHLHTMANTYLVALHRAHALERSDSCEAAVTAAVETLNAQEELFKITDKSKWRIYTYSFYTLDASLFLAALLLERPNTLQDDRRDVVSAKLLQALERLELMQYNSSMAKNGAQVLRKCYARVQKQRSRTESVDTLSTNHLSATSSTASTQDVIEPKLTNESSRNTDTQDIASPSFKSWIEQMDQVMLPLTEADLSGPFNNELWDALLEG